MVEVIVSIKQSQKHVFIDSIMQLPYVFLYNYLTDSTK